ncbi:L30e-like protein [Zopfia rhizophila CBS 207.26]|uniref:L30e-like protein n=1 Tax=Zopfia rhizophila CBS 207.26 TaxID=1314779 RepID=A0A6A6EGE3_9PEZI|nr:L30e-like protein [Zopfia rhizophila CBS 207.26]
MGKDHSEKEKKDKKDRKEKKEKKEKRAEVDGVVKKSKKEKKDKKIKADPSFTKALEAEPEKSASPVPVTDLVMMDEDGDVDMEISAPAIHALVPFAFPLAEDTKEVKKILRTVKKSAKAKTLRRGVKEVVKALRKSQTSEPSSSDISNPPSIVIIAADISPMDVISHIPVLCEDHNIPYIYVKSRAELGESSATKRPTSVVMVTKDRSSKKVKEIKEEDVNEFQEAYGELAKLVVKASKTVTK